MGILRKLPGLSVLLLLLGYAGFGWLLSIHLVKTPVNFWLWVGSGAIAVAINWLAALAWAIAAIIVVFAQQVTVLFLSIGICVVWALLLLVARNELQAYVNQRIVSFFLLVLLSGGGMALGWYADSALIRSIGAGLIR
jgi:hypothetical protein